MTLESLVPPETLVRLRLYEALLVKWQRAVNLVGPGTIPQVWERHFLDSLQLLPLLPPGAKTLYDLGSGAGFPGLVLAMVRPGLAVTLIESDQKKCAFLAAVSRESKTPITIRAERIAQATQDLPPPDILTARALAPLEGLLSYIAPWAAVNPGLTALFPKGQGAEAELAAARADWFFDLQETPSRTDSRGTILCLTNIRRQKAGG